MAAGLCLWLESPVPCWALCCQCRVMGTTVSCLSNPPVVDSFCCYLPLLSDCWPFSEDWGGEGFLLLLQWQKSFAVCEQGSGFYACLFPTEGSPSGLLLCSQPFSSMWTEVCEKKLITGVVSLVCGAPRVSTVIFTHIWLLKICQNISCFLTHFFGC